MLVVTCSTWHFHIIGRRNSVLCHAIMSDLQTTRAISAVAELLVCFNTAAESSMGSAQAVWAATCHLSESYTWNQCLRLSLITQL